MAGATTLRRDGLPADAGRKPVVLPSSGHAWQGGYTADRPGDGWRRERSISRQKALRNQRGTPPKHPGPWGHRSAKRVLRWTDGSRSNPGGKSRRRNGTAANAAGAPFGPGREGSGAVPEFTPSRRTNHSKNNQLRFSR